MRLVNLRTIIILLRHVIRHYYSLVASLDRVAASDALPAQGPENHE